MLTIVTHHARARSTPSYGECTQVSEARANTKRSVGVSIMARCYDGHAGGGACARVGEERETKRGACARTRCGQAKHPARASARRARAKPAPGASCRNPGPTHPMQPCRRLAVEARALFSATRSRGSSSHSRLGSHSHSHTVTEIQSAVIDSKFIGERDEHDQAARQWPYFDARHCCTVNVTVYVQYTYI